MSCVWVGHGRRRHRVRVARAAAQARQHRPRPARRAVDRGHATSTRWASSSTWSSTARARIEEGGGPELLQRLAHTYLGADVKFPPMDDPPPGVVVADHARAARRRRAVGLRRLGVVGWPVAHSRSPAMQNAALAALGLDGELRLRGDRGRAGGVRRDGHGACPPPASSAQRHDPAQGGGARARRPSAPTTRKRSARRTRSRSAPAARSAPRTPTRPGSSTRSASPRRGPRSSSARAAARGRRRTRCAGAGPRSSSGTATPSAPARSRPTSASPRSTAPGPAEVLVNCTSVGLHDPAETFKEIPVNADDLGEYACVVDLVYRDGAHRAPAAGRAPGQPVRRRSRDPRPPGRAELPDLDRTQRSAGRDATGRPK